MLSGLSGVRAIAALIVIIYHLNQVIPTVGLSSMALEVHTFIARLSLVVSVFFFLSGFFRALSYWKVIDTPDKIPEFWSSLKERFLRIAPAYYVALTLSIIVTWIIHGYTSISVPAVLAGITFTTWFSPDTLFPAILNGPLWFVSFDMIGWIMTSLVMVYYVRLYHRFHAQRVAMSISYLILIISASLGFHHLWLQLPWQETTTFPANYWFPIYNPFLFFLHFVFGIVAAGVVTYMKRINWKPSLSMDIVALGSLAIAIVAISILKDTPGDFVHSFPQSPYYFPWFQLLIALVCISLPFTKYLGAWLDNRFSVFTARLSYSLYLLHGIIMALLLKYVYAGGFTLENWIVFSLVTLMASYVSAYIMNRYIEQ